jgi:toxin ParE1/3/4
MKTVWAYEALVRLKEIEDYISQDSPERAARFVDQLIERAEGALSGNPCVGRTVPEIANLDIRELLLNNYRIVYRLNKNNIEILTVFEGHRLLRIDEIGL